MGTEDATGRTGWWPRVAGLSVRPSADLLLAAFDAVLLALGYVIALELRFEGAVPRTIWSSMLPWLVVAVAVGIGSLWAWDLYGQVWRHASAQEARRLLGAMTSTMLVLSGFELMADRQAPWSVVLLGGGVSTALLGAVRFHSRLFSFRRHGDSSGGLRVIVIGAKDAGAALVAEMQKSPGAGYTPVALLDPEPALHGRWVHGIRVAGGIDVLARVAERTDAHQAVLAVTSPGSELTRDVAAAAESAGVALKLLGGMSGRIRGGVGLHHIRDLRVDDLIGRAQVDTDLAAVGAMLRGRRVLITGAGGSIGSEIVRQVARFEPASLVALDHDESHLFDLASTLECSIVQLLADIRNPIAIDRALHQHRPEVVFHAAAHKHVPLLEAHPSEAVLTNLIGTKNLLDACDSNGVDRVVFISTDKAVRPTSVMGASKRLGEQLVLTSGHPGAIRTAVRFGNVLGSRGSVVPTFMRQIEAGGPVTVTDERMTRYFMSIPESVQLVLQAATLARGGDLYVLDMGEPVRIIDLAERMIRLSGRRVGIDIEVQITGIRPGEKLSEELQFDDEPAESTSHPAITRIVPTLPDSDALSWSLRQLSVLAAEQRDDDVRAALLTAARGLPALGLTNEVDDLPRGATA